MFRNGERLAEPTGGDGRGGQGRVPRSGDPRGGGLQGPLQGQLRPPPRLSSPGLGPLLGPFELWALHRKHPFEKVAFTALSELSNTKLRL